LDTQYPLFFYEGRVKELFGVIYPICSPVWLLLAILAGGSLSPPLLRAGDSGFPAHFLGGTVAELPGNSGGKINLADEQALLLEARQWSLRVPYRRIETLEYGQHVSRRYAAAVLISPLLLLSKSRKHFVTIGFVDERGSRQVVVLQLNKGDVRSVLAGLETRTGRRIEYQDDEARKSGKG
jgi:hypothetical protein